MRFQDDETLLRLNAHLARLHPLEDALHDEVDAQLLPVFQEEADELLPKIQHCLQSLHDEADLHLIRRLLHTFKGSARMTGIMSIGRIVHDMEDRLSDGRDGSELFASLTEDIAQINTLRAGLRLAHFTAPVSDLYGERLYRTMRQTAKELNKRVDLELVGFDAEPVWLKRLGVTFEHLLRNAIVHGIEDEAQRLDSGKEAIGEITISMRHDSDALVFEFCDDGRGLDFAALRTLAIKNGLSAAHMTDEQLAQLIFMPGISTAQDVTQLAGRGVGMDVVHSEVAALGGRISVSSRAGLGTKFQITIPCS